ASTSSTIRLCARRTQTRDGYWRPGHAMHPVQRRRYARCACLVLHSSVVAHNIGEGQPIGLQGWAAGSRQWQRRCALRWTPLFSQLIAGKGNNAAYLPGMTVTSRTGHVSRMGDAYIAWKPIPDAANRYFVLGVLSLDIRVQYDGHEGPET